MRFPRRGRRIAYEAGPPTLEFGDGPPVVIMQGFGMQPRTYAAVARLLARHCRVLVPALFTHVAGQWSPDTVLRTLDAMLDSRGIERVTMIGHSFGGALELDFAATRPDRIDELVFIDTLAMSREWTLAAEAVHPIHLLWMATPRAAADFTTSLVTHPLCMARAAWWGFRSNRLSQVETVARRRVTSHVLWANRDSLLSRADGQAFAADLGASFTVVDGPGKGPVDHDWIYRHPELVLSHLDRLGLRALNGADTLTDNGQRAPARAAVTT